MCFACVCSTCVPGAGRSQNSVLNPLDLELQALMSLPLGTRN